MTNIFKAFFSMIVVAGVSNVALAKDHKYSYVCHATDNQVVQKDGSLKQVDQYKVAVKEEEGENDDSYKLSFTALSRGAAIFVSIGDSNTGDYDDGVRVTTIKDNSRISVSAAFNAKTDHLGASITTNVSSNEFFHIDCYRKLKEATQDSE